MAETIILPRQGQSVETCLVLDWKKKEGDQVRQGEILVEVETDKAVFEVESTVNGTLLKIIHRQGEDVPVLAPLAVIGQPGEDISSLIDIAGERQAGTGQPAGSDRPTESGRPAETPPETAGPGPAPVPARPAQPDRSAAPPARPVPSRAGAPERIAISPRARKTAETAGLSSEAVLAALADGKGSGPRGRILEKDVRRVLEQSRTPAQQIAAEEADFPGPFNEVPLKGARKLIAERMLASLQNSAQYTLHTSAGAQGLLAYRDKLKSSPEELSLRRITISDMLDFAVTRVLPRHPALNSHFLVDRIVEFERVHLAFAVDTPRGLLVPVIRNASLMSLKQLAGEAARLRSACLENTVIPEELNGGTFTISNLGTLGIEGFTPVLNPPQAAVLGVGSIQLKPVQGEERIEFQPHLFLSLTADHRSVDGAMAARFLRDLCRFLEDFELLLAG